MARWWFELKMAIGTWNPIKLRRYLKNARAAIDANAYGWANTHCELVELRQQMRSLEAERDQWQKQAMGGSNG